MRVRPRARQSKTALFGFVWFAVVFAIGASTSTVRAYEDQLTVGAGAGYAYATQPGSPHHGALLNLEASLGISPTWSVRGFLGYALHPGEHRLSRVTLAAEALYLVDVLAVVPYAGAGIDTLASFSSTHRQVAFGVHPVAGVDWLLDRSWLVGLCARSIFVLSEFETQPVYLTVSLTLSWLMDL